MKAEKNCPSPLKRELWTAALKSAARVSNEVSRHTATVTGRF